MKVFKASGFLWLQIFCMLYFCSCSLLEPIEELQKTLSRSEKEKPAAVLETEYFLHTIKWPGENLTTISLWYTGAAKNWTLIQKINASIDPKAINIGDNILIPENLLITRKPLPKDFHGKVQKKTEPSSESSPEVSQDERDEKLLDPSGIETQPMGLVGPSVIETQALELFDPSDIETQTIELVGPPDIETQALELFDPSDIETQSLQLFGPSDIETQTDESTSHEKGDLSMPLETIE